MAKFFNFIKVKTRLSLNKKFILAWIVLLISLSITILFNLFNRDYILDKANKEFHITCQELKAKVLSRLYSNAAVLRSGAAFFEASDDVTRKEWEIFVRQEKLDKNMPGIQGVGFSKIINKNELNKHINDIRRSGFPNYQVLPVGDRNIYTSILYLEPFSGRNLRAFGFDMYSEPVRRAAMDRAMDNDVASLSGKVKLIQETEKDVQFGTLMYVPVYRTDMPANTVEQRRNAIVGWVYSPYRMKDLMSGILQNQEGLSKNLIRFLIYDENSLNANNLLFDSFNNLRSLNENDYNLKVIEPINFNGKNWTLVFYHNDENASFAIWGTSFITLFSGLIISLLLFALTFSMIETKFLNKDLIDYNERLDTGNKQKDILIQELAVSETNLKKAIAAKDKLFSIIAHDLRSPFSGFLGLTDVMVNDSDSFTKEELIQAAKGLNDSAHSIFKLLNDLFMWSRSQLGTLEYNPSAIDLIEITMCALDILKNNANQKNITIEYKFEFNSCVKGDKNMISTIIRNLISNAIKFTYPNGHIKLLLVKTPGFIEYSVKDDGVGINADIIPKLFKLDETVTTIGTNSEKGSGLGLILCKEFVEKHGGKIWVQSVEGAGTTFFFTLPCDCK